MGRVRARSEHGGEPAAGGPAHRIEEAFLGVGGDRCHDHAAVVGEAEPGDVDGDPPAVGAEARAGRAIAGPAFETRPGAEAPQRLVEAAAGERRDEVAREQREGFGEGAGEQRPVGKLQPVTRAEVEALQAHRKGDAAALWGRRRWLG